MAKQNNGAFKTALTNYSIQEPIASFIQIIAGKVIAWNAAGEAANNSVDGN